MRVFYGLIITAVILMIGACALKAYKKEGALARVVFLYELGAFICGIIFLVYTYVPGTTITVLCKGLIMASFDWLLILLMYYTQYYTGMFKGIVGVKVFMIAYSLLETVAFLINTWTRWIFDITYISDDQIIVQFAKGNVLGRLHYVFAYGIMLLWRKVMQSRNELLYKLETSINKLRKFCCPDFDEINSREYYKEIIEKMCPETHNSYSYIFGDFDKLQSINQNYGFNMGNKAL